VLDAANVRRMFRKTVSAAGLDPNEWTPRELRHRFVSILSDSGVPLEDIADLVGHSGTTEKVYRYQLRPVLLKAPWPWIGSFGSGCGAMRGRNPSVRHSRSKRGRF
jgi:integrase